jgi:hypothetical protein
MTNFAFQQVDVFTSRSLRGNPLAVVVGADALTDGQMAAFANWTKCDFIPRNVGPMHTPGIRTTSITNVA